MLRLHGGTVVNEDLNVNIMLMGVPIFSNDPIIWKRLNIQTVIFDYYIKSYFYE